MAVLWGMLLSGDESGGLLLVAYVRVADDWPRTAPFRIRRVSVFFGTYLVCWAVSPVHSGNAGGNSACSIPQINSGALSAATARNQRGLQRWLLLSPVVTLTVLCVDKCAAQYCW